MNTIILLIILVSTLIFVWFPNTNHNIKFNDSSLMVVDAPKAVFTGPNYHCEDLCKNDSLKEKCEMNCYQSKYIYIILIIDTIIYGILTLILLLGLILSLIFAFKQYYRKFEELTITKQNKVNNYELLLSQ